MKFKQNNIYTKSNFNIDEVKLTKLSKHRFYRNNNNNNLINNCENNLNNNYHFSDNSNNYDIVKINKNIYTSMIIYIFIILYLFNN